MKEDITNNQEDKNHFSNEAICLSKNPNNNYLRFHKRNIVKYCGSNNNDNEKDNNKSNVAIRCFDLVGDKNAKHDELFVPDFNDDESTEQSISYKKDITFMNKKVKDMDSDIIMHKGLFDNIGDNE